MQIKINGKDAEVQEGCSLLDLMAARKASARAVITELNGQIVRPEHRGETQLQPDDKLEIVHLLGGG